LTLALTPNPTPAVPLAKVITLALLNVVQLSLTKFFCLGVEFGA